MEHYLTLRIVHGATAVLLLLGVIVMPSTRVR